MPDQSDVRDRQAERPDERELSTAELAGRTDRGQAPHPAPERPDDPDPDAAVSR